MSEPGWPARWPRRSRSPRAAAWASCEMRSFQVGTVSSQSWARRWSRAWRMTADCKKPSRPDGVHASSSTAAKRPVPSSGCFASMRRATQRESRTDRRAASAHPTPVADHDTEQREQPPVRHQLLARARADHPKANAGQAQMSQQSVSPVQSRACRKRSATCSNARRSSLLMSSTPPRGSSGVDRWFAPPARFRKSRCR